MKLILSAFLLLFALISRLVVIHNGKIGEKEVVVSIPVNECYRHVTDPYTYPRDFTVRLKQRSIDLKLHIENLRFILIISGTMSYVAQILSVEPNIRFSFILDDWLETRFDFTLTSIDEEKSRMKVTISSNKDNIFYKHIILPIAHLYYSNWLTQCLLRFQLTYS
ncbi:unnamed protein product [Schistosoma turkestanicum]|nr:unnamed protein product [Schistosoma turkestanicum]